MGVIAVLLACLLLTGCSSTVVWEQVQDLEPVQQVASWQEEAYFLQIGVPQELSLTDRVQNCSLYETDDGRWQVQTQMFLASDLDTAVRYLSGYEADRVTILQTSRFGLPEYRFAWYCQTEEGGRLCRADLVMDEMVCYAVVSSTAEETGDCYEQQIRQVFASFGLSAGMPV